MSAGFADASTDPRDGVAALYRPPAQPARVTVPPLRCLQVTGSGTPDPVANPSYGAAVGTLFAVSYGLRFAAKAAGLEPWRVMPLEGLWWADDPAVFHTRDRDAWQWTMLVVQPAAVTDDAVAVALAAAERKGRAPAGELLRLAVLDEGECWHVMHRGPYSAEGPTIEALHAAIVEAGSRLGGAHHEVYLSDPRRVAPERMRTGIRQPVVPA